VLGEPFAFSAPTRRVNWARLRRMDLGRIAAETDVRALMAAVDDLAFGSLEGESPVHLSEPSLLRLARAQQMALQVLLHETDQLRGRAAQEELDLGRAERYLREMDLARAAAGAGGAGLGPAVDEALRALTEADAAALTQELAGPVR